jgi:hypothetical protein
MALTFLLFHSQDVTFLPSRTRSSVAPSMHFVVNPRLAITQTKRGVFFCCRALGIGIDKGELLALMSALTGLDIISFSD